MVANTHKDTSFCRGCTARLVQPVLCGHGWGGREWPEPQSYSEGTQLSKTLRFPFTQTLMKSARNHILRPESHGLLPSREGELLFS